MKNLRCKNYILKFKIILICVFIINLILSIDKVNSQSTNSYNSPDETILRTDSEGNILGGGRDDWDFDISHYKDIIKYKEFFFPPIYKDTQYIYIGDPEAMFSEINENTVTLSWIAGKLDTKEFIIERKKVISDSWEEIGKIESDGYSSLETEYKFVDHNIDDGIYYYRLKYFSQGSEEYYALPNLVITKEKDDFEFYPAYPNPVSDTVNISFYLPKKDVVSLFFLNGDTTYILDHEPQERGFYKITIDKSSLGFENEIKRLYIGCKSCNKKKNFGDIQF